MMWKSSTKKAWLQQIYRSAFLYFVYVKRQTRSGDTGFMLEHIEKLYKIWGNAGDVWYRCCLEDIWDTYSKIKERYWELD